MKEYLKEAIADSGMDASKVAPTLFTVDNGSEQLDKRQGESFDSIVANYFTSPKELVPTLNWLLISSAPGSRAALSRIGKSRSDSSNISTVLWTCLSFSELTVSPNQSCGLAQPMLCTMT